MVNIPKNIGYKIVRTGKEINKKAIAVKNNIKEAYNTLTQQQDTLINKAAEGFKTLKNKTSKITKQAYTKSGLEETVTRSSLKTAQINNGILNFIPIIALPGNAEEKGKTADNAQNKRKNIINKKRAIIAKQDLEKAKPIDFETEKKIGAIDLRGNKDLFTALVKTLTKKEGNEYKLKDDASTTLNNHFSSDALEYIQKQLKKDTGYHAAVLNQIDNDHKKKLSTAVNNAVAKQDLEKAKPIDFAQREKITEADVSNISSFVSIIKALTTKEGNEYKLKDDASTTLNNHFSLDSLFCIQHHFEKAGYHAAVLNQIENKETFKTLVDDLVQNMLPESVLGNSTLPLSINPNKI